MKQLTMTKVLTPLAALAFAFGVQAAVPSFDGFEDYTAGTTVITNQTGWSFTYGADGADDASAITAYDNNAPSVFPDGTTAGSNYLKLSTEDGMLFRNMDGANGETVQLDAGLYVDTDVQFTITDPSDRPEVTGEDKFIVWLEANGADTNLCVWARQYTAADGSTFSNAVYSLVSESSGDAPAIVPGEWHRLTVKALSSVGSGFSFPAFQVYLDGALLKAGSGQYITTTDIDDFDTATGGSGIVTGQAYFPSMTAMSSLSKIGFSGEGALDNVVVTREVPGFADPTTITFTFDEDVIDSIDVTDLGVTLTNNATLRVAPGTTFDMAVNWKSGYSSTTHTLATASSADAYATVSDLAVTAVAYGAATIALTTTAKDTVDVTFDWSALNIAMGEHASENTAITFTVGGTDYDADLNEETCVVPNLKVGTNITVTVTFTTRWKATYSTSSDNVSINDNVVTINTRGGGTATVSISAEQLPSPVTIGETGYDTLAEALAAATAGQTITLNEDVTAAGNAITTAAATIDLNGKTLTLPQNSSKVASLTFTGTGAATLKGGDLTGVYHELTITAPAGEDLTFDGVTFHASVKPVGSGDLFTATNCQFLCDFDKTGAAFTDGSTADVHSYGVLFTGDSLFAQADIVDNYFDQGRRAAVQASFAGDLYFYGNTVVADKLTSRVDGATTRYPALQTMTHGRVFIENNTFSGQYLGEAFCLYNKGTYRSTAAAVVFNGNTVGNGVNYLWGIYDVDATTNSAGEIVFVDPNLYFGANTVDAGVDTTGCIYKTTTDGTDVNGVTYSHTPATLALPTGVATVYEWTHGSSAGKMYVSGTGVTGFVNDLSDVAADDTVIAVPGVAAPEKEGLEFSLVAPYKNEWTAAAPAAAGWVDDPTTIPANTSVATQYPDLASSVLATADAKEVTEWAATNNVAFADVAAATSGTTYSNAFLLNCAPTAQAVEDETAAFKATITVAADGTVTVSAPEGKKYNGTLQLKGKAALTDAEWTNVNAPSSSYKFYKYVLSF